MYTFPMMRKWMHDTHVPSRHSMAVQINHMVHDERFWPVAIISFLALLLLALALWSIFTAETPTGAVPPSPIYPYVL